jgi:hypothetical protein
LEYHYTGKWIEWVKPDNCAFLQARGAGKCGHGF